MEPISGWFKRLREGKGKSGHRRWYQLRGRILSSYKKQVDDMRVHVGLGLLPDAVGGLVVWLHVLIASVLECAERQIGDEKLQYERLFA